MQQSKVAGWLDVLNLIHVNRHWLSATAQNDVLSHLVPHVPSEGSLPLLRITCKVESGAPTRAKAAANFNRGPE